QSLDLLAADEEQLRQLRWAHIAVVLQSAMNALNPVIRIGVQLTDVLRAHRPGMERAAGQARAAELLEMVGISAERLHSYPHELSGGMRQRVMIAMALALEPRLVILDEPTTALDVVTQREILEELIALRERLGFAVLFITHDLSLLVEVTDSIAVMYAGRIVERAAADRPGRWPSPHGPRPRRPPRRHPLPSPRPPQRPRPSRTWGPAMTEPGLATPQPAQATPVLLEARELTKNFWAMGVRRAGRAGRAGVHAAERVSLSLPEDGITAVVGESGSGKSTLARLLARLITPTSGH